MVVSPSTPLSCPQLPLAVYREVQAHLQQLPGVTVELLPPLPGPFDYLASQIGGIQIHAPESLSAADAQYVQNILDYYAQQFGAWQPYGES
ncbi:hypothetical protein RIF25_03695 [Thermosynechococcaceae cyanobacterium BACA0444]|uniref:Uncharacterized protein n=1 Tax=Pseudocalidococcus azoricus BACA0444 TaxID=2918990 RepID=A0AAE4JV16_9CYAN|nr:hypothetical protein [Pseudocalidococcus azoricus]MDS3859905.1 hypothetical protein [Pseudocalidococcus azoricus BACA0444]